MIRVFQNAHMPFPPRPFMLGREGTPLAALRQKEQGDWNDLTAQEKVKLKTQAYWGFKSFFRKIFIVDFTTVLGLISTRELTRGRASWES